MASALTKVQNARSVYQDTRHAALNQWKLSLVANSVLVFYKYMYVEVEYYVLQM